MTVMSTHQSHFLEAFYEVPPKTAIPSTAFETPQASTNRDDAPHGSAVYFKCRSPWKTSLREKWQAQYCAILLEFKANYFLKLS